MKPNLEELQLDALREVANVGAGHAARAMGDLTGTVKVSLEIPRVMQIDREELVDLMGGKRERRVATSFDLTGALVGQLLAVWSEPDADWLAGALTESRKPPGDQTLRDSALCEVGNILASAYVSAVGQLAGLGFLPSVPSLHRGTAADVAKVALPLAKGWVLETRFRAGDIGHQLVVVPDARSVQALLQKLGVQAAT